MITLTGAVLEKSALLPALGFTHDGDGGGWLRGPSRMGFRGPTVAPTVLAFISAMR